MSIDLKTKALLMQQQRDINYSRINANPYGASGANNAAKAPDMIQTNIVGNPIAYALPDESTKNLSSSSGEDVSASGISDMLASKAISGITSQISNLAGGLGGLLNGDLSSVLGEVTKGIAPSSSLESLVQAVANPRSLTNTAVNYGNGLIQQSLENIAGLGAKCSPGCFGINLVAGADLAASASDAAELGNEPLQETSNEQATTQVMSPVLWTGGNNWFGLNYGMLSGTRTISQKMATGQSVALGCIAQDYSVIMPKLDPGAICIKGFGNNLIHWESGDRLSIKVNSEKNSNDFAYNKGGQKPNVEAKKTENGSSMFITLDGHEETMTISVMGTPEQKTSTIVITGTTIVCTTTDFIVNAEKNIIMSAGENILISAGQNISTDAQENISTSAGENIVESAGDNISNSAGSSVNLEAGSSARGGGGGAINLKVPGSSAGLTPSGMKQDAPLIEHNAPVKIVNVALEKVAAIKEMASGLKDKILGGLSDIAGELAGPIAEISKGMDMAKGAMDMAKGAMGQIQGVVGQVTGVIGQAQGIAGQIVGQAQSAIGGALGQATQGLGDIGNKIGTGLQGGIADITKNIGGITNVVSTIKDKASGAIGSAVNAATQAASGIIPKDLAKNIKVPGLDNLVKGLEAQGYVVKAEDDSDIETIELSTGSIEILSDTADLMNDSINIMSTSCDHVEDSLNDTKQLAKELIENNIKLESLLSTANMIVTGIQNNTLNIDDLNSTMTNLEAMATIIEANYTNLLTSANKLDKQLNQVNNEVDESIDVINETYDAINAVQTEIDSAIEEIEQQIKEYEEQKAAEEAAKNSLSASQEINYRKQAEAAKYVIRHQQGDDKANE